MNYILQLAGYLAAAVKRQSPGDLAPALAEVRDSPSLPEETSIPATNVEWGDPAQGKSPLIDGVISQPPPTLTDAYRKSRAAVRDWHLNAPLDQFHEARRKF